jgi:hypothetical protein
MGQMASSRELLKKYERITATTDLGNRLNGSWFCIWDDLANPKIGFNLIPNPL